MNDKFGAAAKTAAGLFGTLDTIKSLTPEQLRAHLYGEGVYVMFDLETPVYVGRTRRLAQRIAGHRSGSQYSSTFALRNARKTLAADAPRRSTRSLMSDPMFIEVFKTEVAKVKLLQVKFIECSDVLTQYLLEAYAIVSLDLDRSELATH